MIKNLSNAYAPSAKEEEVRKIIIKDLSDFYSEIKIDNLGNLIIHKPGKMKTIAITAPMDEVSFIITHKKGTNNFIGTSICSVNPNTLQNISVIDEDNNLYILSGLQNKSNNIEKIRNIDFLKTSNCKVEKLDNDFLSNSLVYNNFLNETDDKYIGKALERSVCCSILCDIARNVANSLYEYYFVFSAQNYCDKKGACTATFGLKIDELYNLCCVDAENENIESGKGVVLVVRDKMLISTLDLIGKFSIDSNIQKIITSNLICEGGFYQKQHTTQKVLSIGIPINFLGCFNEVVSKSDINDLKTLILEKVLP